MKIEETKISKRYWGSWPQVMPYWAGTALKMNLVTFHTAMQTLAGKSA